MQLCCNIFKYILMSAMAQALVEAGTMTKWWIASLSGLRFCPVAAVFEPIPLFWPCWAQTGAGSGLFWWKWWIALVVPTSSSTTSSRVPLRLKRLNCLQPPWSLGALWKRQVRLTSELSMVNVLSPNDLMSELWILSVRPNGLFPLQYMKAKSGQWGHRRRSRRHGVGVPEEEF